MHASEKAAARVGERELDSKATRRVGSQHSYRVESGKERPPATSTSTSTSTTTSSTSTSTSTTSTSTSTSTFSAVTAWIRGDGDGADDGGEVGARGE